MTKVDIHSATDPEASAWVSANAGAGKTHLLTDRVTRLLLSGAHPSRILCLTYTKAAAAEMATRLFGRLGEWALISDDVLMANLMAIGVEPPDPQTLRRTRRLFAQALETPGGLKIQTIHAFCQHLLSRFPIEAQIPPRFSVLDDRSAAELMAKARNAVLECARGGEGALFRAVGVLAVYAGDARFAEILNLAVAKSSKLQAMLDRHHGMEGVFAHVRANLGVAKSETDATVVSRFCAELAREAEQWRRVAEWLSGGSSRDIERGGRVHRCLSCSSAAESFEHLCGALLKQDGEPFADIATKPRVKSAPHLAALAAELQCRLIAANEKRKAAIIATLTEAVITVANAVLGEYRRSKRARAELDYDDLIQSTRTLLERGDAALWVLHKLDGGLDHILVDEAQDTSPEQWTIVAKLAEEFFAGQGARQGSRPRTLFAVGDEKQSIFSFQGAEPVEFARHLKTFKARAEGAGLAFADLKLAVSRRSARAVLDFVDAMFANDLAREGLTSSDDPIHHDPHRSEPGRVEVWPTTPVPAQPEQDLWAPVDAPPQNSAQVTLATRIAQRIAGWLRDGIALPGTDKPITPSDVMILVRRRNAFAEEMIRQLMEYGVPVAGADRMVLTEQIAIADLVALGRFALLPQDDLSVAALLKSPLIGLTEDDLFALAHARTGALWRELSERKTESPAFARAHAFLSGILSQADFLPPFEFYARALTRGLRKRLAARLGAEAEDAIDEFLALALAHESAHPPSLESFLDWFEKGASEVKRDMEQGAGAVRVMTVHGAKGLEGNIIILPDTGQIPDHERRSGLLYTEDCVYYGVNKTLETGPVTAAKAAARMHEMREYRRLLYVAATRAREWLIVYGYETKRGVDPNSWYVHAKAGAERIGRNETLDGETIIAAGAPLPAPGPAVDRASGVARTLPAFLFQPAPEERAQRPVRPSDAVGADEPALTSPLADDGARFKRGLLIHALLAALPDVAADARERMALAYLGRHGIASEDALVLAQEALAVMHDTSFAPLFASGSRAEVAVAARLPELGNMRVNGQIDRLAVTETRVLIADYKTNRPPPAKVEDVPKLYRAQMALYRAALTRICPGKRIDCALIWTEGARLMELPAVLLDAEIAAISNSQRRFPPDLDPGRPHS